MDANISVLPNVVGGVVYLIVYRKFSNKNILWKYLENINIDIIDYV